MASKPTLIGERRSAATSGGRASYHKRRQEITEAAVGVFHPLGYAEASLSSIAAELGIDRATLYYYFSSKEQIFDEVVRAVLEENATLARRIADSQISPARKLRELISAFMISYSENYPLLYIYVREDLSRVSDKRSEWSQDMRRLNKEIESAFIEIIKQGLQDKSFRSIGSPKLMTYGILGMLNWSHRWYRPDSGESASDVGRAFADFALSGLESPY